MNRPRLVSTVGLLVVCGLACAGTPARPRYKLEISDTRGVVRANGLRVIILPDPSASLVEIDVRYEVGAAEDPPGRGGLAHLAEHMMFEQHPTGPTEPGIFTVLRQL